MKPIKAKVAKVRRIAEAPDRVYDLTVGGTHNFFADGLLVSNCDDPHNVADTESEAKREGTLQWWNESMTSRLNDPKTGAFVVIQQRVHHRDLLGHILAKEGGDWTYLCLPAEFEPDHPNVWVRDPRKEAGALLWPEHVPREQVDGMKRGMGEYASAGQLQQRPAPREGGMFKRSWFPTTATLPPDITMWSRAWDLAATIRTQTKSDPDFTATCKIGFSPSRRKYIVAHVDRWRVGPGEVRRLIRSHAEADGFGVRQTVPKDPGQAGVDQAQSLLLLLSGWDVTAEAPSGDKGVRASAFAGQAEVGNVELLEAPWNEDFLTELGGFPLGAHDDMLDATASAFNRISDGVTGIMDFYQAKLDERTKQRLAAAQAAADAGDASKPQPPGMTVSHDETDNLAHALFGRRK